MSARLDPLSLNLDAATEVERIATTLRSQVLKQLRRRGIVLGLSGGVDSSVVAALCVRAFGRANVFGIYMPEQDSEPDSLRLGRAVAESLRIETVLEDITPILNGAGCYRRRDEYIRRLFPGYGPGWRSNVVLRKAKLTGGYSTFHRLGGGPTTDTYSQAQTQEEFFFGISLRTLDVCMSALDHGVPAQTVGPAVGLTTEQVLDVFRDIAGRRRTTRYQHEQPLLVDAPGN